ncbi:MAG: hypothetical protein QM817_02450 [Archangium sp.]
MRLPIVALALSLVACGRTEPVRYGGISLVPLPEEIHGAEATDAGPPPCTAVRTDQYDVPPFQRRAIDVLFVIDDSCSMEDDQRQLGNNLNSFFSAFKSAQVDFHVGVITTDMTAPDRSGRLVAPFVTDQTPDIANAFEASVLVGTGGSGDERGLQALRAALRPPLINTTNAGFIRQQADFATVILADEDDHAPTRVDFVADTVRQLKPDQQAITVGAILLQCGVSVNDWRYAQFARLFGSQGIITKCTQDYASTLRTIAGRVVNRNCIVGLQEPFDEMKHIRVTLNGVDIDYRLAPPEDAFPNGSIEAVPCPEAGGRLELTWSLCDQP